MSEEGKKPNGCTIIFLIVFVLVLFGQRWWTDLKNWWSPRTKVQHGEIELFYSEGATKEEADRVCTFLSKESGTVGTRRSAELKKAGGKYQLYMVIMQRFRHDSTMLASTPIMLTRMSRDLFNGAEIEFHVCDEQLNSLQTIPMRSDLRFGSVVKNVEVFYSSPADKVDAERLAMYFVAVDPDGTTEASLKLARRGAVIEVHSFNDITTIRNPIAEAQCKVAAREISAKLFKGALVEIHLCDANMKVFQVVKP